MIPSFFFRWLSNEHGRDFVVGDIHGHAALLDTLLDHVRFDPAVDRVFGLGDLIDRGPDSQKLLERARDAPWFHSLRGNHEAMLKAALDDWRIRQVWYENGGGWARDLSREEHQHWAALVATLPLAARLLLPDGRKIGLVHAELHVRHRWAELEAVKSVDDHDAVGHIALTVQAASLWGRSRIRCLATAMSPQAVAEATPDTIELIKVCLAPVTGVDLIISGHSALTQFRPVAVSNLLFIDTGSYLPKGRLTLVEPLTGRYWQSGYRRSGATYVVRRDGQVLPAPAVLSDVLTSG